MSPERLIAAFVLRHRTVIGFLLLVGTVFFGWQFRNFSVAHDPLSQLPDSASEIRLLHDFGSKFGQINFVVVALEGKDEETPVFSRTGLSSVADLTKRFERVEGIESVVSLSNVASMGESGGMAGSRRPFDEYVAGRSNVDEFKESLLSRPEWIGTVVSEDGTVVAINLFLEDGYDSQAERASLVRKLRSILEEATPRGVRSSLTGSAVILVDSVGYLERDISFFLRYTPLVMVAMLFLFFRRILGVVVPFCLIVVAVTWTLGLYFLAGNSINMATTLLPTLVALITLSDVIHALTHYFGLDIEEKAKRIRVTMEHMIRACFMTSVTTAAGIGSLATSEVRFIHEFGVWAAISIFIAYFLVITLLPVLLSLLPAPAETASLHTSPLRRSERLLDFVKKRKGLIWATTAVTITVSLFWMTRVRIEAQISTFLPSDAPAVKSLAIIDEKLAGTESIEVMVTADSGTFENAWAIAEVDELHRFVRELPGVRQVYSPASLLRATHRSLGSPEIEGADEPAPLPSDADIADYLFLLSASAWADNLSAFLTDSHDTARVSARVPASTTAQHLEYISSVEAFAKGNVDTRLRVETTGRMKVFSKYVKEIVESLLSSLIWTIAIIALVLAVHFRSLRIAFVSLLPNVIPLVIPLGVMGMVGISLNASTMMVSCIAIGLAVDNAIHFLARYQRERSAGESIDSALLATLHHTGRAIILVSVVIAAGFTLFLFSSFTPNRNFGILVALAMVAAPVVDLFLLPRLILTTRLK
ncbi:MAG: efflux RND transporter permease subunit [Verrucomicrobiota bacterium]